MGNQLKNESRQEDIENWNEEELYDLSNENSRESQLHEIAEIETPHEIHEISELDTFGCNQDMNKYIMSNQPHHTRGASSIYSQNTHDLNKLLYSHKREPSGRTSSYKYSEIYQSYQSQFKSMRTSDDQNTQQTLQVHWNRYNQERNSDVTSNGQVQYTSPRSTNKDERVTTSVDFHLTSSKNELTDEDQYDGMNFIEYCKSATESGDRSMPADHTLAISDEQRENLLKRIMLLKMQKNHSQSDEGNFELSQSQQEYSEQEDRDYEGEGEYDQEQYENHN